MYLKHETLRRIHEMAKDERHAPFFASLMARPLAEEKGGLRETLEALAEAFSAELGLAEGEGAKLLFALDLAAMAGKADAPHEGK